VCVRERERERETDKETEREREREREAFISRQGQSNFQKGLESEMRESLGSQLLTSAIILFTLVICIKL
jgi:hypothetical protein